MVSKKRILRSEHLCLCSSFRCLFVQVIFNYNAVHPFPRNAYGSYPPQFFAVLNLRPNATRWRLRRKNTRRRGRSKLHDLHDCAWSLWWTAQIKPVHGLLVPRKDCGTNSRVVTTAMKIRLFHYWTIRKTSQDTNLLPCALWSSFAATKQVSSLMIYWSKAWRYCGVNVTC